ncbi:DUF108 domain-containing protein [Sinirhodobacter populi]|uniref:DUF108 domain-containing protein n=1 Tax=Paenirhodobacter populi TaxID=2306993 RepID=A0A443K2D8_9RHOB|nr:aspartate dehydrogenase domain-containing protein [Sinirhodobacter populi]RWR26928.1 DUF108 domain-containing protein [Sinirhodobacter populi]
MGRIFRVGVIGAGTIARAVIRDLQQAGHVEIDYVLTTRLLANDALRAAGVACLTEPEEALARPVDLVVEAAVPEVIRRFGLRILCRSDLCCFSLTALAEPALEAEIRAITAQSGFRCFVPHGAVLGLDGFADGRDVLESVTITTTKSAKSMGLDPDASGLVFEGTTRAACGRFPRNVNVHAAIALAGIGFDRTRSRIVVAPGSSRMEHLIEARGPGMDWTLKMASESLGGVTGSYTPRSAIGSVRRIIAARGIVTV